VKFVLYLILITFVPAIELRGSIPYGMLVDKQLHWFWVALICTLANIAVGFVVFYLIEYIMKAMQFFGPVHRLWMRYVERTQKNIHASVEKYGEWALAIFIGIPLPGTGAYSGALAAYLLGMSHRKFAVANIVGVTIAGVIVTAVCLMGGSAIGWLRIFIKQM
jgi:uncharacterized membrane protein